MTRILKLTAMILILCLALASAAAQGLTPLPLDTLDFGPAPKDENYLSDNEYLDESIHVQIFEGRYVETNYMYAYVKISDPSQLRTAPAGVYYSEKATFSDASTMRGRLVAKIVNAVVAINGDYYTKTDKCQVVMRQTKQYRNIGNGLMDILIVDRNGDFSYLRNVTRESYADYYEANADSMYQVFCLGPVLVENGESVVDDTTYANVDIGPQNRVQRAAIAQIGPLEYLLITTEGPQSEEGSGMTIVEFAQLCEDLGYQFSETGCSLAFNLDGGNSSTLVFKRIGGKYNNLLYTKINSVGIERFLGDIIYFATLVE